MDYSDNDDDIFDYEYNNQNKTTDIFDLGVSEDVKDFQKKININLSESDIENTSYNLHANQIQFSLAYHRAFEHFVYGTTPLALAKSFTVVLDTLTNGDFSLISRFYSLEMSISRKISFLKLSYAAIENNEQNNSFFIELGKTLKIEINKFYIDNFFISTLNICEFSLNLDRAEYLTLSKKLQIPVSQELFIHWKESNEDKHNVDFEDFKKNVWQRVFNASIENGILQELSTMLDKPARLAVNNNEDLKKNP